VGISHVKEKYLAFNLLLENLLFVYSNNKNLEQKDSETNFLNFSEECGPELISPCKNNVALLDGKYPI